MADISQLSLSNTTYDLKDATARTSIAALVSRVAALEAQMPAYNNSIILDSSYVDPNSQQEGGSSNE